MVNTENTEQKILQAAMEIFIQKGRHGAKMQEIADKAGINKAMLHYYFRSKDKLYAQVFESVYANNFGTLHKIFETDENIKIKLSHFVDQYTNLIRENPQIPLFLMRELSEGAAEIQPVFNKILSQKKFTLPFSFIQSIQQAIQNGEIRAVDPRHLLITIIGSVVFYFLAEPLLTVILSKGPEYKRETFIEERKKIIIDIIFNGIKP